jgi:hypothetical protein
MDLIPGDARLFVEKMANGEFEAEATMTSTVHGGYQPADLYGEG